MLCIVAVFQNIGRRNIFILTKLFERALPEECRSSDNVSRVRSYFLEYYSVHNTDYTRPYDKVEELLSVLNSHGVKIAVALSLIHI